MVGTLATGNDCVRLCVWFLAGECRSREISILRHLSDGSGHLVSGRFRLSDSFRDDRQHLLLQSLDIFKVHLFLKIYQVFLQLVSHLALVV